MARYQGSETIYLLSYTVLMKVALAKQNKDLSRKQMKQTAADIGQQLEKADRRPGL